MMCYALPHAALRHVLLHNCLHIQYVFLPAEVQCTFASHVLQFCEACQLRATVAVQLRDRLLPESSCLVLLASK